MLTPTILITTAGAGDAYLRWALFAALVVSGTATFIQAVRIGRIGAGYILVMGSTAAYLAVGISAVRSGGPELMATLIVVAAFTQFILGSRMAMLRRVFTPTVAGTVLMLIPVSIAPIIYGKLISVPATAVPAAAPVTALVTLAASVLLALRLSGIWRLWGAGHRPGVREPRGARGSDSTTLRALRPRPGWGCRISVPIRGLI